MGIGIRSALVVTQIAVHVPELAIQRADNGGVLGVLQLQLQQLLDHVELAELPIDQTCLGQGFHQRGIQLVRVLEVLECLHTLQEASVEQSAQPEMEVGLNAGVFRADDALLQGFSQPLPVVVALKVVQTLL